MNWKREHTTVNGSLFCTISVWDENKKEWISKQDVGTESMTEREKGQASDSFKRAAFNWGIGRELYTAPFIWINFLEKECEMKDNKPTTRIKFKVKEIAYNEQREICKLVIVDNKGEVRFPKNDAVEHIPGVYSGGQLAKAIEDMKNCGSRAEINNMWNSYKELQNNIEFRKTVQEMCEKYPS